MNRARGADSFASAHTVRAVGGHEGTAGATAGVAARGAAAPAVTVTVEGRSVVITGEGEWLIGRRPDAGVVVRDRAVSRTHAVVRRAGPGWRVDDAGSRNGLWQEGARVDGVLVHAHPVTLRLGGWDDGVPVTFEPVIEAPGVAGGPAGLRGGAPAVRHRLAPGRVRLGRGADNDVVLSDLLVSRHHAELHVRPDGVFLVDRGSANGTFVDGSPIDVHRLVAGQTVAIGPFLLHFDGTELVEQVDDGDVFFGAAGLTVTADRGRRLLDDVGFSLRPRTLMAVVGPSGAGKSTLLGALTGLRPATSGTVTYAGRDLYANYGELRQRIGFVPQDDILHAALTVEQALTYGAQLRFPRDTTKGERSARVREVAAQLSLSERLGSRISTLSGGERKRASTAMELLTRPSLLFLDEPTSGLDADLDREVMHQLRALADDGRTVVVVTHNLEHLDVCDLVMVLARGGHVAYFGPPDQAHAYFGAASWADVFARLKTRDGAEWSAEYGAWTGRPVAARHADAGARGVPSRGPADPAAAPAALAGSPSGAGERRAAGVAQLSTLVRRSLRVIAADPTLVSILVGLPVVLAAIARVVPGDRGLRRVPENVDDATQLLLVLVVGACLAGSAAAVRELVKERPIYLRERAVGLSAGWYLTSKVVVLAGMALLQGVALTLLALVGRPDPDGALVLGVPLLEVAVPVALVAAVSTLLGLVVSAAVRDENQAMPLLVVLGMAQLVMSGALVPIVGRVGLEQLSWVLPARWGFAAVAGTVGLNEMGYPGPVDHAWDHRTAVWLTDVAWLGAIAVVCVAVTYLLLRRLDPRRSR